MPLNSLRREFGQRPQDNLQYATPSERKQSINLIEGLLDTIAESVSSFRPSKSLAIISRKHDEETRAAEESERESERQSERQSDTMPQNDSGSEDDNSILSGKGSIKCRSEPPPPPAAEIDLVISGGGFKGYFMCGAAHVLTKELAKRNMRINRIGGTSAGAWAGLFICCGFTASHWMETYFACKDRPQGTIHEVYTDLVTHP